MFNPRSTRSPTAKTANRLSVFTPLLQHILQDFASIRRDSVDRDFVSQVIGIKYTPIERRSKDTN